MFMVSNKYVNVERYHKINVHVPKLYTVETGVCKHQEKYKIQDTKFDIMYFTPTIYYFYYSAKYVQKLYRVRPIRSKTGVKMWKKHKK